LSSRRQNLHFARPESSNSELQQKKLEKQLENIPRRKMAFKDRFLSAVSTTRSTHSKSASSSTSSNSSSASSAYTEASKISPSSTAKTSTSSSMSSLFRNRRSRAPTDTEQWVDPPLKYSDPPQQEYVDMLAAWDWDGATRQRRGSWESGVSPGTSRRGSWF